MEYLKSILEKDVDITSITEQEKHLLYQIIIQHGLTIDETPENSEQCDLVKEDSHNLRQVQTINAKNIIEFSQLFYQHFPKIISIIELELSLAIENNNLNQKLLMAPSDPMVHSLKESLSALSYLFSGLWITDEMKHNQPTSLIILRLFRSIDGIVRERLIQCLLALTKINQNEIKLILIFLLSKQQLPSIFLTDINDWFQFIYSWILSFCQQEQETSLYQPINLFTIINSNELVHAFEATERFLQDLSQIYPKNNESLRLCIPETFQLFLITQFYCASEHFLQSETPSEEVVSMLDDWKELRQILYKIIYHFSPEMLSTQLSTVLHHYKATSTKLK